MATDLLLLPHDKATLLGAAKLLESPPKIEPFEDPFILCFLYP